MNLSNMFRKIKLSYLVSTLFNLKVAYMLLFTFFSKKFALKKRYSNSE